MLLEPLLDACPRLVSEANWRGYVERLTDVYRERRAAMLDALTRFIPQGVQ